MTYKELEKTISTLSDAYGKSIKVSNIKGCVCVVIDEQIYATVYSNLSSYFTLSHFIWQELEDNLRHDLLEVLHEFAQTPINSRHLFPKFYISSKLTPKAPEQFLFKFRGNIDYLAWGVKDGGGTEFTQEEINYICDKFHTNLSDFIIEEVED